MLRYGLLTCALILFTSCQDAQIRRQPQAVNNYSSWLAGAEATLLTGWSTSRACAQDLQSLNDQISDVGLSFFDVKSGSPQADLLLARGFALRKSLKERLPVNADVACYEQARRFLYLQRVTEEVLIDEKITPAAHLFPKASDFRNGDIVIMRGKTFFSATIAQMSDVGAPYSHAALVHKGPDGTVRFLESLAEKGVVITSYEEYAQGQKKNPLPRFTILRARNSEQAAAAADRMYARILADKKAGRRILYDYVMNIDNRDQMFCTEMVSWSFSDVGEKSLPISKSRLSRLGEQTDFFKKLGISRTEMFMPADLELDPRFDIVAEYRDGPALLKARRLDALLRSMFRWMTIGYEIQPDFIRGGIVRLAFGLRDVGILKETIPPNVPKTFADNILAVYNISLAMTPELERSEARTLGEMMSFLKDFRRKDCIEHRASLMERSEVPERKVVFHREFRANDSDCR